MANGTEWELGGADRNGEKMAISRTYRIRTRANQNEWGNLSAREADTHVIARSQHTRPVSKCVKAGTGTQ